MSVQSQISTHSSLSLFLSFSFGFVILTIILFSALQNLHIPSGQFIDWIIGGVSCWWLLIIVTVPWNMLFEAKAVIDEGAQSQTAKIFVDKDQLEYAKKIAKRALFVALFLHVLSAAALFSLSYYQITPVGYIGCIAALLLTALRPAIRGYEYIYAKLNFIKQRFKYPREDVELLRQSVKHLEEKVKALETDLNPDKPKSFAANQNRISEDIKRRLENLVSTQQKSDLDNKEAHEVLRRDGQQAIARISADTQFLDHVREIVRMIKTC